MDLFGATVKPIVALLLLGEAAILAVLVLAFLLARYHRGAAHHYLMLGAFLTDIVVFKPLMFSRAGEAWGSFPWEGSRIAPHLVVSVSAALIGAIAILLGFRHSVKKGRKMFLPPKGRLHKHVGLLFVLLWTITFVVGVAIFVETYTA